MKGGSVCSNSTIFNPTDGTKFQAYTYSGASIVGMDCGFFIQVNTLPTIPTPTPVTSPSDGKPRKDIFVNISGSGEEAKATEFTVQDDMFIGFSAHSRVSTYRDASDNKIDAVLRRNKNEGNPIAVIDGVVGAGNYQIIIFDSDGKEEYLERGHTYNKNNKKEPKDAEGPASAPEPVVETPVAPESANVKHDFYELAAVVGTDKVGSVDVLKMKKIRIDPITRNDGMMFGTEDPVINKDNFSKIVCEQMKTTLKESDVSTQFNKSVGDVDLENSEIELDAKRHESSWESFSDLKGRFIISEEVYKKSWNAFKALYDPKYFQQEGPLKILNDNIDLKFNTNMNTLKEKLPEDKAQFDNTKKIKEIFNNKEFTQVLKDKLNEPNSNLAIEEKYRPQQELKYEQEKLYKLVYSINEVMKKSKAKLDEYSKNYKVEMRNTYGQEQEPVLVSNILSRAFKPHEVLVKLNPNFPKEILANYTNNMNIGLSKLKHNSGRNVLNTSTEMGVGRKRFGKSIRDLKNTAVSGITKNRGIVKRMTTDQGIASGIRNMFTPKKTSLGGKRKTRKIKARKTRKNVQRKRRQSKKH